jgi:fructokinase
MEKRFDVASLGELLIDFAPGGTSPAGSPLYECNPGGGPPNVLTTLARQGGRGAYLGKVGEDFFGHMLEKTLLDNGIDTAGLRFDEKIRTTLAFVSLDERGDRSFSFFRNPGADTMLRPDEVDEAIIRAAKIFHFCSLSLTDEPARSATKRGLEIAKSAGLLISYDPNLRPPLWPSMALAKEQILSGLVWADIVKLSEEEFFFLSGQEDYAAHAAAFAEEQDIPCLFVTLGPKGAFYCLRGVCGHLPTYDVKVADTTGSGDAFIGAVLAKLCRRGGGLEDLDEQSLREIVDYANAAGALTARMKGGVPAIPTAVQIEECRRTVPLLRL